MISLRAIDRSELAVASQLCLRSKAHWGYDADFMRACEAELTLGEDDLSASEIVAAMSGETMVGIAQVMIAGNRCHLDKLFVDPDAMGRGVGRVLFVWASSAAKNSGATDLIVEADPDAVPFYLRMGCRVIGSVASGSIPGRSLPLLALDLRTGES